jgi:ribulose-5-phosphate 4-epimerase/fuculose-1-phosphate aldolase
MEASDLLRIDHHGKIVEGGKPDRQYYNTAAFIIHAKVHSERPNANAVCHSHSPYGKAFSVLRTFAPSSSPLPFSLQIHSHCSPTTGKPLPLYTQDSCAFWNDIGMYNAFGGVVLDMSESAKIAEALGPKNKALSTSPLRLISLLKSC